MRYSQNMEQDYILAHFKDKVGTFLDLGAYDGKDLSNTRALMELGWDGICFEPHPDTFERLATNCMEFKNVLCYEMALGKVNGTFSFNANDTYYSTLIDSELERWKGTFDFRTIECEVIDFKTFMLTSPLRTFNFISIDCEGMEKDILPQIDLDKVGCEMICVEWNGKDFEFFDNYIKSFSNFRLIHTNAENLIYGR